MKVSDIIKRFEKSDYKVVRDFNGKVIIRYRYGCGSKAFWSYHEAYRHYFGNN